MKRTLLASLALARVAHAGSATVELVTGGIDDSGSTIRVSTAEIRADQAVVPTIDLFGAFGGARVTSDVGDGTAIGNVRLGARLHDAIVGADGTTRRSVAITLTLPTASGQGFMDGAARAAVDAAPVDDTEAFTPHALGVAVDGVHRLELGAPFFELGAGAHVLHSSSDDFALGTFAWGRAALAAGTRLGRLVIVRADLTSLVPIHRGGHDLGRVLLAAHAGASIAIDRFDLTLQVRTPLNAPTYANNPDLGLALALGARW